MKKTTPSPAPAQIEDSCWLLLYTALWQHDALPAAEIAYAKQAIHKEFISQETVKQAFLQFCERVLIANRLLQVDPSHWIDVPSIWLHPEYEEGFSGTLGVYNKVVEKRQRTPDYQEGIAAFTEAYWQYLTHPSKVVLKKLRKRLLLLREYGLLQLWNNVIILHQSL